MLSINITELIIKSKSLDREDLKISCIFVQKLL